MTRAAHSYRRTNQTPGISTMRNGNGTVLFNCARCGAQKVPLMGHPCTAQPGVLKDYHFNLLKALAHFEVHGTLAGALDDAIQEREAEVAARHGERTAFERPPGFVARDNWRDPDPAGDPMDWYISEDAAAQLYTLVFGARR